MIVSLYADGGVIHRNPSPIGGTWAWRQVDADGNVVAENAGPLILFDHTGVITNNVAELVAVVYGLESILPTLGYLWQGTVYSDSLVTLQRVFNAGALHNVPAWLRDRLWKLQRSGQLQKVSACLLDGHPSKAQLAAGIGKRGNPVSAHNVWCDAACREAGRRYEEGLK